MIQFSSVLKPWSSYGDGASETRLAEEEPEFEDALSHVDEAQVELGDDHDEESAIQNIDSDDASFVDRSKGLEASEYVASEVEEEASADPLPEPEYRPPDNLDPRPYRPQTPLLDDAAPERGYQKVKEGPKSREASRQSIGVSTIIEEEYPTAQKIINALNLRQLPKETATHQRRGNRTSLTALPSIIQGRKDSDMVETPDIVDNRKEVRKSSIESVAVSVPPGRARSRGKSNESNGAIQARQERSQKAFFRLAVSNMESTVDEEELQAPKLDTQTLTRAYPTTLSTNMPSTSVSDKTAQLMTPPPLPQTLPSRAIRKPDPPRKSWPESGAEKTARVVNAAEEIPVKSSNT